MSFPKLCSALLILTALLVGGCAATGPKGPQMRYLWPTPPDKPRIEFIKAYSYTSDLAVGGGSRLMEMALGEEKVGLFYMPAGVASSPDDSKLYVSMPNSARVTVLDLAAGKSGVLGAPGDFNRPMGLWVDSRGVVYIADSGAKKVLRYNALGDRMSPIERTDKLQSPAYVAVNEGLGRVYVSDSKLHKVVVFDMEGNFLFDFGEKGGGEGHFYVPQGIAIDKENRVFVCDLLNARVQVFDADGAYLYNFGDRGDNIGNFDHPKSAAFDSDGNLHVVDTRLARSQIMSPDGQLLLVLGTGGKSRHAMGFTNPVQIFISPSDRIYIIDNFLGRISVWQYLDERYLAEHPVTEEQLEMIRQRLRALQAK